MSQPVISVENLSKAFQIYKRPTDIALEMLTGKPRHDLFWALRDVSLTVNEHDRVGIIGSNGSGKSTLLKAITGNLPATSGKITVRGNISAMLSLATSLNPEETGLSNIRFNLMLNGCPKNRVAQLTDEIIEFTELGPFIYQPVKTYSAGMNAKLAFGIATAIEPEILIIDEVLSVGDAYFVGKAMKRMVDLCNRGKALVFVSHSTSAVQMLCNKVVWMENGAIRMAGRVDQVIKAYEEDARRAEDEAVRTVNAAKSKERISGNLLASQDISNSLWLLRLISPPGSKSSGETYFVREIQISVNGGEYQVLPMEHDAASIGGVTVRMDLLDSGWGRLYQKDGYTCRMLTSRTGKARGGRIIFDHPTDASGIYDVKMKVEFSSASNQNSLTLEQADVDSAAWKNLEDNSIVSLADNWFQLDASATFHVIDENQLLIARKKLADIVSPPLDIVGIEVFSAGAPVGTLMERQSFEIRVHVFARRQVARADVGINIYRADGVYSFWQSSGQGGVELTNFSGNATISFQFDNNYFAAGDYKIGAYCGNGWDPVDNFPHSEMFVQKINEASFRVVSEYGLVAFGLVNARVPVAITYNDEVK